jgi:hypothetical protein
MAAHLLLENVDLSSAPSNGYIIEVGSVREPGELPSSLYFANKGTEFGLNFLTVDSSEQSWKLTQEYVGEKAVLGDGKEFLENLDGQISVLYLDNFDYPDDESHFIDLCQRSGHDFDGMNWTALQEMSPQIHYEQILAALPKLSDPCWIIVDNTARTRLSQRLKKPFWGKGASVVPFLIKHDFPMVKEGLGGMMLSRSSKNPVKSSKLLNMYCGLGRTRIFYKWLGFEAPELVD